MASGHDFNCIRSKRRDGAFTAKISERQTNFHFIAIKNGLNHRLNTQTKHICIRFLNNYSIISTSKEWRLYRGWMHLWDGNLKTKKEALFTFGLLSTYIFFNIKTFCRCVVSLYKALDDPGKRSGNFRIANYLEISASASAGRSRSVKEEEREKFGRSPIHPTSVQYSELVPFYGEIFAEN